MTCPRGTGCCSLTSEQAPCLGGTRSFFLPSSPSLSPSRQLHALGTAQRRWLTGERVMLILNFRLSFSFSGGLKVNFCRSEVKKINNSVLANCSQGTSAFLKDKNMRWVTSSDGICAPKGWKSPTTSCKTWAKWGPAWSWGFMHCLFDHNHLVYPKSRELIPQSHTPVPSRVRLVRHRMKVQGVDETSEGLGQPTNVVKSKVFQKSISKW